MPSPATSHRHRTRQTRGFALILTLALLGLLLLLLAGLATYTRLETRAADNALHQVQARQNALMALNIALAQLQKYAGPDQRVTATAEAFGGANGTEYYTGVWDATTAGTAPLTWLTSGNEVQPTTVTPSTAPSADYVELVGEGTAAAGSVLARKQSVTQNVLGLGVVPVGTYAWWVGDQGVKASLGHMDRSADLNYAPYVSSNEMRNRIRQQANFGASPAELDPHDPSGNAQRVGTTIGSAPSEKLETEEQISFLSATGGGPLAAAVRKAHYQSWAPRNFAVLANTSTGGLRQDLSLKPELLGSAFAAWANYLTYTEDPLAAGANSPMPAYGSDPMRRRYKITPPVTDQGLVHSISPALSLFFLQFNVRRTGGNSASSTTASIEVRARMVAELWNTFSGGIVPEDLKLEVTGLPSVTASFALSGSTDSKSFNLQSLYGTGNGMTINLTRLDPGFDNDPDVRTWLPGRTYYWRTAGGAIGAWTTELYNRTITVANANLWTVPANQSVALTPARSTANAMTITLAGPATQLTVKLRRASDNALLATYLSPQFDAISVPAQAWGTNDEYRFGYAFRVSESTDSPAAPETWLVSDARDPRDTAPSPSFFRAFDSPNPNIYVGTAGPSKIANSSLLLDRVMGNTGKSYNEDVPLFELPRAPVLSVGMLQHLKVAARRPYTIGNSWGATGQWNALFDRYFFSGLAAGVGTPNLAGRAPLPNTLLLPLNTKSDGTAVTTADLVGQSSTGYSSKFLLQSGAFNLNSTSALAWQALLRSLRFSNGTSFTYLNADATTGSGPDSGPATLSPSPGEAVFYRFSQTAQETYKSDATYVQSANDGTTNIVNTPLFRRGLRSLSADETSRLSTAIVTNLRQRQTASGPLRSLEELLNADPSYSDSSGNRISLLEKSIADAGINTGVAEFSSQWLLQGDVMTSLAPVLFARSDTFVVRCYGEATNPVFAPTDSGFVTGRAWCEAVVQRLPAFVDSTQAEETPLASLNLLNRTLGRRFKIVSLRWLNSSEI